MSSAAQLDYAPPAQRHRVRVPLPVALLSVAIALLGIDALVLALPAFGPFYTGSPMLGATRWAQFALWNATWVNSAFAISTTIVSYRYSPGTWHLRLARSIALALALFHLFFAPGDRTYGRLLWGSC